MPAPTREPGAFDPAGQSAKTLQKRSKARLPWLDGIASSRNLPGGFENELVDLAIELGPPAGPVTVKGFSTDAAKVPSPVPAMIASRRSTSTMPSGTYTPSTYSSHTLLPDQDVDVPPALAKKDAPSYEKLVAKPSGNSDMGSFKQMTIPTRTSSVVVPSTTSRAKHAVQEDANQDISLEHLSSRASFGNANFSSDSTLQQQKTVKNHAKRAASDAGHVSSAVQMDARFPRSKTMQLAVQNLESLMKQSLQLAEEANNSGRADEVTAVLEQATKALRKATQVEGTFRSRKQAPGFHTFPPSGDDTDDSSSELESDSSFDLTRSRRASRSTMPTEYSGSVQSAPATSPAKDKVAVMQMIGPESTAILSEGEVSPGTVAERSKGQHFGLPHALKRTNQPDSTNSIVVDFAYVDRPARAMSKNPYRTRSTARGSRRASSTPRRPQVLQEDVDQEPEDIDQQPIRLRLSDLAASKSLRNVDPIPISEPVETGSYGPNKRKPRNRGRLASVAPGSSRPGQPSSYDQGATIPVTSPANASSTPSVDTPADLAHVQFEASPERTKLKYKRRPIAREWKPNRKRLSAVIACLNTALVGLIAGIYAGEVPKIQYQLADTNHVVILGNVCFFIGLGITTTLAWPLPLLHGRKPYILIALAVTLPLQFPQAIAVSQYRSPDTKWYTALLLPRAFSGLALGFTHVNSLATLLDLFGASLQSSHPHQEVVDEDDIRRQGGGIGLWLGLWAWCFVGSLSAGFLIGTGVTASLPPAWGFYFVVILLAAYLFINIVAPETRRAPHRRSVLHYFDEEDNLQRKIARGEVKLHLNQWGPKFWWEEVGAGVRLMTYMLAQVGFCVLAIYLAWIYALVVLVTLLLGALLSNNYLWTPQYVGLGVFALAIGALLSVPLSKANLFSRDRMQPARTDSMTFERRVTWSSHLVRRCIFTFALPIAGMAFTLTASGPNVGWAGPVIMSATVGFLATLAVAECVGIVMETFDTCDLQPGVNSRHRQASLDSVTRRRRTNYTSFPRVIAGLFASQGLAFFFAAAATGVSGRITRALGAQAATGVVAGILLFLTILLSMVLWRFRTVQVIPNHAFGTKATTNEWNQVSGGDMYWRPVIVGFPSGKIRRMNLLETGKWSRWTEIRRLNKLVKPGTWEVEGMGRH